MAIPSSPSTASLSPIVIPPLENGDRLTRAEFERRYAAMPSDSKAELIEGTVYTSAALRLRSHGQPHGRFMTWLGTYEAETPGLFIGDAPTILLDPTNEPQPDLALLIDPDCGGQTRLTDDDYVEGAPELLAEVAASTVSIDLGPKKTADERNGVQEYWVWRVLDQQIDWFVLQDGRYIDWLADRDGVTRSRVFPGLWLDRPALVRGDMKRVLSVLQEGIETEAHESFVASLQR